MNLATIPDEVWTKLATHAAFIAGKKLNVNAEVGDYFYAHIYETWGKGKVVYKQNTGIVDAGWQEMVKAWFGVGKSKKKLGDKLKDHSVGSAAVQADNGPDVFKMARLWEQYNDGAGDRFQFVVNSGGGIVLFNRMRRACQGYIIERLASAPEDSVVMGWKVFGEEGQADRSDSSVVYLATAWTDPRVIEVINGYIWPNIKDLVDPNFKPLGFYPIDGKPLWAMPLPNEATELRVLGQKCQGSAGGLMSNILGLAFEQTAPTVNSAPGPLAAEAKLKAQALVKALYP